MMLNTRKQIGKTRCEVRSIAADVIFHLLAIPLMSNRFEGCRNSAPDSVVRESMAPMDDDFSVT